MTIQHLVIPDPFIHEPKGVSTAPVGTVYVANGAGTGGWAKVNSVGLLGLAGDGGSTNLKMVSNGTNGFNFRTDAAYGQMVITNNAVPFATTAAVDPTLQAPGDYVLFTGLGAPWAGEHNFGIVFDGVNKLTFPVTGVYTVDMYANISLFPNVNAFVGARFRINGTTFGARTTVTKANAVGDAGHLVASALLAVNANDYAQFYIASTHTGNLTIRNMVFAFKLVRQTA